MGGAGPGAGDGGGGEGQQVRERVAEGEEGNAGHVLVHAQHPGERHEVRAAVLDGGGHPADEDAEPDEQDEDRGPGVALERAVRELHVVYQAVGSALGLGKYTERPVVMLCVFYGGPAAVAAHVISAWEHQSLLRQICRLQSRMLWYMRIKLFHEFLINVRARRVRIWEIVELLCFCLCDGHRFSMRLSFYTIKLYKFC